MRTLLRCLLAQEHTVIELMWPNGPMLAMSHMDHNHKSIKCLNHSDGDNHHERAVCCGDLTSSLKHHFCWHSDPSLDGESHKGAHCHLHICPHGEGEKMVSSQAVTCQHFGLKWSKLITGMSASYVLSCPKEGVKESPRPIDDILIGLLICY